MVHHIVMWKFKPEVEDAKKPELKKAMAENLKSLVGKVPGLLTVDFVEAPLASSTHDMALVTTLEKAEDVAVYAKHPELALGGMLSAEARAIAAETGVELVDYFAREELTIRNAVPTAEGALEILLHQRSRTLWGSAVLLLGFGPVGQALGVRLAALGAAVTVLARRPAQRALAESLGLRAAPLARLPALAPAFDTVVNTVPAQVLSAEVLARLRPESLIIDLASRPGGTDFGAAARCGHRALHALSLPAACAPETAGEAVAQTVCEMLREREEPPC